MHDNIYIIDQDPGIAIFHMIGFFLALLSNLFFHKISNGLELSPGAALADNEEIRHGHLNLPEIQRDGFAAFFFFYGPKDGLEKR